MAHQTAQEMRDTASGLVTQRQLDEVKQTAASLTQRAVITLVLLTLKAKSGTSQLVKDIMDSIKMVGCIPFTLETTAFDMRLNITVTIVDRGTQIETMLPEDTDPEEVFKVFNTMKAMAIAYWREFKETHADLYTRINALAPGVTVKADDLTEEFIPTDWSDLHIDPKMPTTMFFEENFEKRISVFTYWVNRDGKPWVHKTVAEKHAGKRTKGKKSHSSTPSRASKPAREAAKGAVEEAMAKGAIQAATADRAAAQPAPTPSNAQITINDIIAAIGEANLDAHPDVPSDAHPDAVPDGP